MQWVVDFWIGSGWIGEGEQQTQRSCVDERTSTETSAKKQKDEWRSSRGDSIDLSLGMLFSTRQRYSLNTLSGVADLTHTVISELLGDDARGHRREAPRINHGGFELDSRPPGLAKPSRRRGISFKRINELRGYRVAWLRDYSLEPERRTCLLGSSDVRARGRCPAEHLQLLRGSSRGTDVTLPPGSHSYNPSRACKAVEYR